MTDIVTGSALYLRNMHAPGASAAQVERAARDFARRAKKMGLSWSALGAVWQDSPTKQKFLNTPDECAIWRRVFESEGLGFHVWGYPWLGGEQKFVDGMLDCAGDAGKHLLDPELGMNPKRDPHDMDGPNASAGLIVHGLRSGGAKVVGTSTFGGIPKWFPLRAFIKAGVDYVGGQTYSEDKTIDTSIATFIAEVRACGGTQQIAPNFGLYARNPDGSARPKTTGELIAHLNEFINEGEPVRAAIGWAENFLTVGHERALYDFSRNLATHRIGP